MKLKVQAFASQTPFIRPLQYILFDLISPWWCHWVAKAWTFSFIFYSSSRPHVYFIVQWIMIYPMDSAIHPLNNSAQALASLSKCGYLTIIIIVWYNYNYGLWVNSPWGCRPNGLLSQIREGERNNCFSKIQLVGPKNIETEHRPLDKAKHYKYGVSFSIATCGL